MSTSLLKNALGQGQSILDLAIDIFKYYYKNYYQGKESIYITQDYFDYIIWDITDYISKLIHIEENKGEFYRRTKNKLSKLLLEAKIKLYNKRVKIFKRLEKSTDMTEYELLENLDLLKSKKELQEELRSLN